MLHGYGNLVISEGEASNDEKQREAEYPKSISRQPNKFHHKYTKSTKSGIEKDNLFLFPATSERDPQFKIISLTSSPLRPCMKFCLSVRAQASHERNQTLDLFLGQIGVRRHSSRFADGDSALFNHNPD